MTMPSTPTGAGCIPPEREPMLPVGVKRPTEPPAVALPEIPEDQRPREIALVRTEGR